MEDKGTRLMGSRGPLPKPNAIRRNKRVITGTATVARPSMPAHLPPEAKREWHRVVPELERMGRLTALDRAVLVRYCVAWADWLDLNESLVKTGRLIRGKDGGLVKNPLWLLRRDAEKTATELGRQLGLTPDARIRSGVAHEVPELAGEEPMTMAEVADFEEERRRRIMGG